MLISIAITIIISRCITLIHLWNTYFHFDTWDGGDDTVLQYTTLLINKS